MAACIYLAWPIRGVGAAVSTTYADLELSLASLGGETRARWECRCSLLGERTRNDGEGEAVARAPPGEAVRQARWLVRDSSRPGLVHVVDRGIGTVLEGPETLADLLGRFLLDKARLSVALVGREVRAGPFTVYVGRAVATPGERQLGVVVRVRYMLGGGEGGWEGSAASASATGRASGGEGKHGDGAGEPGVPDPSARPTLLPVLAAFERALLNGTDAEPVRVIVPPPPGPGKATDSQLAAWADVALAAAVAA